MATFDEFLAGQEAAVKAESEAKQAAVTAAQTLSKGAREAWGQVQAELAKITHGRKILDAPFKFSPEGNRPAMLMLDPLAASFEKYQDGEQRVVMFGHVVGNEHLWESELPQSQIRSYTFLGHDSWGVMTHGYVMSSLSSEQVAQDIAQNFTTYYIAYVQAKQS